MTESTAETVTVNVEVRGTYKIVGEVDMPRPEYDEWCKRIDSARGFECERVADDLMERAKMRADWGDVEDLEVDDFHIVGSDG